MPVLVAAAGNRIRDRRVANPTPYITTRLPSNGGKREADTMEKVIGLDWKRGIYEYRKRKKELILTTNMNVK